MTFAIYKHGTEVKRPEQSEEQVQGDRIHAHATVNMQNTALSERLVVLLLAAHGDLNMLIASLLNTASTRSISALLSRSDNVAVAEISVGGII